MKKDYQYYENRADELLNRSWKMLINGEMVLAKSRQVMDTFNPANQELLSQVPFAQEEDVDRAVEAAYKAFETWHKVPISQRVEFVHQLIKIIKENREDLALIDSINSGNSINAMLKDVEWACETMLFLSGAAFDVKGSTLPSTENNWHFTTREPYGVIAKSSRTITLFCL
jgi:betaine-aldehyde dehydrogenase